MLMCLWLESFSPSFAHVKVNFHRIMRFHFTLEQPKKMRNQNSQLKLQNFPTNEQRGRRMFVFLNETFYYDIF